MKQKVKNSLKRSNSRKLLENFEEKKIREKFGMS